MYEDKYKTLGYLLAGGIGLLVGLACVGIVDAVMVSRWGNVHDTSFGGGDFFLVLFCVVVCALIFGPFIQGAIIEKLHGEEIRRENERINKLMSFRDGTLSITARDPGFQHRITIESIQHTNYKYNDPKLVYTGATVGGVSMGGFHVEGGDYTKQVSDSGKFRLMYQGLLPIKKIYLTSQLLAEAEKDPVVSKFLDGGELDLRYWGRVNKAWSDSAIYAASRGDVQLLQYANQQANLDTYLSREDCVYVSQWLCGEK